MSDRMHAAIIWIAIYCALIAGCVLAARADAAADTAVVHAAPAAPTLGVDYAIFGARYTLRRQLGERWEEAGSRRVSLDRRLSRTRVRFLFELPGLGGAITIRSWPGGELSAYLHWDRSR